ncbi:hypothetical protein FNT36_14205 [Hymenobacter setariae]|uniref:Uncharacterized protein n=1 Tax=Hymenobacter setariae TaxID=2594794 RepID=A0A558BVS0_9BACT|nr:hypothetical protein [Hymenobacter setariae]TVT40618.1 hypothetical protein FNT36_14205 [Hymenobacter setariae]
MPPVFVDLVSRWLSSQLGTGLRGDMSPSTQKTIMRESTRQCAVRGTSRLTIGGQRGSGSYTFDAALQAAPTAFR